MERVMPRGGRGCFMGYEIDVSWIMLGVQQ